MKKNFLIVGLILVLFACNPKNNDESNNEKDTIIFENINTEKDVAEIDSKDNVITESEAFEKIKEYLSEENQDFFKQAKNNFNNFKTSQNIADYYFNTIPKMKSIIEKVISQNAKPDPDYWENIEQWEFFSIYIPEIELQVGDGFIDVGYHLSNLRTKAKETPEKDDDLFFDVLNKTIFDLEHFWYNGRNNWTEICDYSCSINKLGSDENIFHETFKAIDKALNESDKFSEKLISIKEEMISSIENAVLFVKSKQNALNELSKIIENIKLSPKELNQLKEIHNNIEKNKNLKFNSNCNDC
ncbi:MAG: hypothetical protein JXR51_08015 [Bacteroidales bacterium]|nr:hypothetical protein [Bacteroidales bacterium]MBN2757106.1 hypothetical protein [Bacteroidales bacterium]